MTCPKCGAENLDQASFCESCGEKMLPPVVFQAQTVKRPVATIALSVVCLILAVALVLSLVIRPGQSAGSLLNIQPKTFATPEDAIKSFVESLAANDADAALSAFATVEQAQHFDFVAWTERFGMIDSLSYAPPNYEFYRYTNELRDGYNNALQIKLMIFELLDITSDYFDNGLYYVMPNDDSVDIEEATQDFIDDVDPGLLSELRLVRVDEYSNDQVRSANYKKNLKNLLKTVGADEIIDYCALLNFDGDYYVQTFQMIRYGNSWKIQRLNTPVADFSSVTQIDEDDYEDFIDGEDLSSPTTEVPHATTASPTTRATTAAPTAATTARPTTVEPLGGLNIDPAPEKGPSWVYMYDYSEYMGMSFPAITIDPFACTIQALDNPGGSVLAELSSEDGYLNIATLPTDAKVIKITASVAVGAYSAEFIIADLDVGGY